MDFEKFKETIRQDLLENLPQLEKTGIEFRDVEKLQNQSYTAMSITPENSAIGASVNIEKYYQQITGRSQERDVIAYQIRQSFKPGEVTPEEANQIGYELALQFTKGRHSFLVATHVDRTHIHNHIVFNSTSLDCSRKFRDFRLSGLALQRVSDRICLEHGLSIITPKPYSERRKRTVYPKKETHRETICAAIDATLEKKPEDFEALLALLGEAGYEWKRGKYIAVRGEGQKLKSSLLFDCFGVFNSSFK